MAKSLSNKDKKRIVELFEQDNTVNKIAKEVGFPVKVVKDYLLDCVRVAAKADEEKKLALQKSSKKPIAKDLMINTTRDQKRRGVAVNTKAASEVADQFKLETDGGEAFRNRYSDSIAPATRD